VRWIFAVVAALTLLAALGSSAWAGEEAPYTERVIGGDPPNMLTTNVPYVAWRGEQIRAVKCDGSLRDGDGNLRSSAEIDVLVETWSGPGRDPQLEQGTVDKLFWSSDRQPCVRFDMVSSDAGLARVKLVVSDRDNVPIVKHQFLMIWLSLGGIDIDEVGKNDPTGDQPEGSDAEIGDPKGDGTFLAGDPFGRVQVKVTGRFPHPLASGGSFLLPHDWPKIAAYFANDNNPYNGDDTERWDIHDDQDEGRDHVRRYHGFCDYANSWTNDDVDNCEIFWFSNRLGPFSNVFGSGVQAGGPFDPLRPGTLLSNGKTEDGPVDWADAPMPATRVDIEIAPNSGKKGDISGAGQLLKSDKADVYSRDGNGWIKKHNLYAPYYSQWIPATAAVDAGIPEASGIDGPQKGNNFEGFLLSGLYENWDTFPLRWANDHKTECNKYVDFRYSILDGRGPYDVERVTPKGPQKVAVYTDEHGEAQVRYDPYAGGFYYDNLPVVRNDNRGCDLQDVDVLGTSDIKATARYPYQPVDDATRVSATLRKTVYNEFDKSLSYYPKGTGSANSVARIVVVHANDVNGEPFKNETVCFYVDDEADGFRGFVGETGPKNDRFTVEGTVADIPIGDVCRRLDKNGNAAIEVFNSDAQNINVIAEFLDEGLLRDIDVDFAATGSQGGYVPETGNDDNETRGGGYCLNGYGGNCPGSGPPSHHQIDQTVGQPHAAKLKKSVKKAKKAKKAKRHLAVSRVILKKGKRCLVIRVNSPRKSERIKVRSGKLRANRSVATNRLVTVKDLTIPAGAKVTVSLTG
jgi:hypothetical protein